MSQAPSMPMFWDAYIADTTHLTTEEHGAYLLLLAAMWRRNGWVPDDDRDNARILGLTTAKWKRIKDRLSPFLMFEDGEISQKNLLKIWKKTQEKIEINKQNGAKGGRAKASNNNSLAEANATNSLKRKATIPEPEPEPEERGKPLSKREGDFETFWEVAPRKVGKGAAQKAYAKAIKRADPQTILFAMQRHAEERRGKDQQYTPHPATWLNQDRWLDAPPPPGSSDFHDEISKALGGEYELPGSGQSNHRALERLPSALPAPGTSRDGSGHSGTSQHGGGDQQTHLSLVRPKRFG